MVAPRSLSLTARGARLLACRMLAGRLFVARPGRLTAAQSATARAAGLSAVAVAVCAFAVGCGTIPAPAGGSHPGKSPTESATNPAATACARSALKIRVDTSAAGVAAGSSLLPLEFRNISSRPCTLPGYAAVSFAADSAGPDIGAPAVQQHSSSAPALILQPGTFAHAWLQITDASNYPASACKPVTAGGLRVSFTTTTGSAFVPQHVTACARQPQDSTVLAVFPLQAGQAKRGTAP